jgi:acetyl esterase/lipase
MARTSAFRDCVVKQCQRNQFEEHRANRSLVCSFLADHQAPIATGIRLAKWVWSCVAGLLILNMAAVQANSLQGPGEAHTRSVLRDLAYGGDLHQRLDVYRPKLASEAPAPVLFMVHGGAWHLGDKATPEVVANKVAHWVSRGFVLVSVNYRMLPEADPLQQADDVARALAFAQAKGPSVAPQAGLHASRSLCEARPVPR